jgi:hypothetical protein
MPDVDPKPPFPPKGQAPALELEQALRRAARPKTAEPDIAADDEGASAAAEELKGARERSL